eukprot:TRINITY_DN11595_c0_g1_i2.p1 TRINITY_DN11595_c0_g1~~TRINITY_DN11595_c0_g1_i2.p1  ORF type:complete len:340 (+),score=123.52 TRINITY_DN11595_c0_g1_i2:85-1020(+)
MTADLEQKTYNELWSELRAVEKKKHEIEKTFKEPSRDRRDDKKRNRREFDRDDSRDRKRERMGDLRRSGGDSWRDRNDADDDKPKVSSTVVSVAPVSNASESKPTKTTGDETTRTRTRNLLGKLLVGTLNQFKQDISQKSEVIARREEIEHRIDEKFSAERQQEMEKAKQALEEHKERANAIREILKKKEEEFQVQHLSSFWAKQEAQLSSFIKTKEGPSIYYLPAKHNDKTTALLPVKEQSKEASTEEEKPTPMDTTSTTNEREVNNDSGSDRESDHSDDESGGRDRKEDEEGSKQNEEESSEKQDVKDD